MKYYRTLLFTRTKRNLFMGVWNFFFLAHKDNRIERKFLATAFASEYHLMDSTLVKCEPFGAASREPTNWLHARFESSIVR